MKESYYITHEEVMAITGKKQSTAYGLIRECNKELKAKGYRVVQGKTPRKYFMKRMGLADE
ncbi:hypothetical protein [Peptostreptococcus equinus]|uniref:ICEBs1 excisionase n=1 Tax=Peptostreptococcus equinus TaxID=3003601 RepID=A0ABY7JTF0_9FIRM|nr:hypothetical protein [Peptostreptococcus sp. CBA3647]WAW15428.1 hypothetical protein O0R46_03000 [Peptostreptococcus sp. CBA3647]